LTSSVGGSTPSGPRTRSPRPSTPYRLCGRARVAARLLPYGPSFHRPEACPARRRPSVPSADVRRPAPRPTYRRHGLALTWDAPRSGEQVEDVRSRPIRTCRVRPATTASSAPDPSTSL
jgi:hypothetical protein